MSQVLFPIIRRMPHWSIETAYRALETADPVAVALYKRRHPDELPLPPMRFRARIGSRSIDAFLSAGHACADALRRASRVHLGTELVSHRRILDFGCGVGRTLRHIDADVFGCDVDREAIEWMQRNVSGDRFLLNQFEPPLPWPDASFDLVYSFSIFTHLNERSQIAWLEEIARVLAPGSHALITVQSQHALSMVFRDELYASTSLKSRLAAHRALDEEGFIFEGYERKGLFPGVTSDYGLSFHSPAYIDRVWGKFFEIGGIDVAAEGLQDVVALTRRV